MFNDLKALPADPILGLSVLFKADQNPKKVDLGVGIYKDDEGQTPILKAVREAYRHLAQTEPSKAYAPPQGWPGFTDHLQNLVFGARLADSLRPFVGAVQTPGGCGALRLGFELIKASAPNATVWVSDPTWANHTPIIHASGLKTATYRYYNSTTASLDTGGMFEDLKAAKAGDIILLHGCCHNPTGADFGGENKTLMTQLLELANRGVIPFIDMAYQGFGDGLEKDATLTRTLFETCPEALLTYSCSKNFGLYRERAGAVFVKGTQESSGKTLETHLCKIARESYSMPPAHGAALATAILESEDLSTVWKTELEAMRQRMQALRRAFTAAAKASPLPAAMQNVETQKGMFSILDLTPEQIAALRGDHAIYMPTNGRINIAGLNPRNIPYVIASLTQVLK